MPGGRAGSTSCFGVPAKQRWQYARRCARRCRRPAAEDRLAALLILVVVGIRGVENRVRDLRTSLISFPAGPEHSRLDQGWSIFIGEWCGPEGWLHDLSTETFPEDGYGSRKRSTEARKRRDTRVAVFTGCSPAGVLVDLIKSGYR